MKSSAYCRVVMPLGEPSPWSLRWCSQPRYSSPLGFRITALLFIAGLLLALGAKQWIAVSATAIAGSFGVFHVFYYWLKVPLPIGLLGI